ncbi:MAG: hypothetical protein ABIH46_04030 [Chloroflexota bacterium]
MGGCVHYWKIGPVNKGTATGVCNKCLETREFVAVYDGNGFNRVRSGEDDSEVETDDIEEDSMVEQGKRGGNISEKAQFHKEHKEEIIADAASLGLEAMRAKWGIPATTWNGLRRRWGLGTGKPRKPRKLGQKPAKDQEVVHGSDSGNHQYASLRDRVQFLEGYRQAVREIFGHKED